ncbi:hypothetical protein [Niabella drilacis]|uniref:Uncharacterized protein n=1 Tax=Niabella drilacis (strain DSM 25811 / CCM 8410 / CCUG 62505 / LMG 26954 / E90) TaxID=1285928 RepID=A0A1G7AUT7_NIADE|nr:hypothetical protein [Niabella drilacis]SDE18460.1 hypothetical protein SAMN04487894_12526 [Niabella drilacis]
MKVKLILLAFVLLIAGVSKSEAQHYRYEKKSSKYYKKSYRPAAVVYYPVVHRTRYYNTGRSYPPAYRQHYRYRHHRHLPPGQAKKYYRHHKHHKRVHYY